MSPTRNEWQTIKNGAERDIKGMLGLPAERRTDTWDRRMAHHQETFDRAVGALKALDDL